MSLGLGAYGGFSRSAADRWAAGNGLPSLKYRLASPRKIMIAGTSIDAGYNTAFPSGNAQGYRCAPIRRLRDAIRARGFYAQDEFFAGTMGYTTASSFQSFDPRFQNGAGWEYNGFSGATWSILQNSTTTTPFTYTPDDATQTFTVWVRSVAGTGSVTVTCGAVTKTVSIQQTPTDFIAITLGESDGVTLGQNTYTVARASGTIQVVACWARNARLPAYQLLNCSASGGRMQHIANSADLARPFYFPEQILTAGDEYWIAMGPNDWRDNASPIESLPTYRTNMESVLDRRIANNIKTRVIIPARTSIAAASIANQDLYNAAIREVAASRGAPVFDFKDRWGEHADALAAGLMNPDPDYFHPIWRGAEDIGQVYAMLALAA
ncbi:lysophospholipase L1-like esterase [Sphingobium jiangsuense]|uniref:Lysophospholipase L1-like esterase n=3 Tax=Sphingobium jiangsuense TaxID=870476 RepID=A0A7W6FRL0_9SPHN|nr:SGNH/GDSL hydrolase family protein [Sphingobium jiangsuense]MBB3927807.1 lysophospholipase L1-like esterase [Sphingobium jiangsuense]